MKFDKYWFRFEGVPVRFPFGTSLWKRLYGIRIGSWFFGAIKGDFYKDEISSKE